MTLRQYLGVLRKRWWVIVATATVTTVLAVVLVLQQAPVYQGTVTFFATTPSTDTGSPLQGDQFGQQRVNSYVKLLQSQRLAERVLESSGADVSAQRVMRSIEGRADLNTVLLTASVRDTSLSRVDALVTAVGSEFPEMVEELESQAGTKEAPVRLDVVSGPSVQPYPVSPLPRLWVAVGLLGGILLGAVLALLHGLLDRSVRSSEDLRRLSMTPVLTRVPVDAESEESPLVTGGGARWVQAEAYRQLRTNLEFVDVESPAAVVVVTSPIVGEGKSTTAANLAIALAQAGRSVLLVDADLRRPVQAKLFGLEGAVGLTTVLAGQVTLDDAIQSWSGEGVDLLASGPTPPNPSELLGSAHMVDLIEEARSKYDNVVIDTAPLRPVTDGAITAARSDGAVLVVRYGKTRTHDVEEALEALRTVDARLLGTVLNRTPLKGEEARPYESYS